MKNETKIADKVVAAVRDTRDGTATDQAYRLLKKDILTGTFKPGHPLRLELLRDRYGFSFSPVREALNRLHIEQLVDVSALRGFRVAEVSIPQMWDTIETRILIELEAFRRSIEKGEDDWEAQIVSAFHSFSRCAERQSAPGWQANSDTVEELENRHREFHQALISACRSPSLLHLSEQMYHRTERYRRPALIGLADGANLQGDKQRREHAEIMKAALARKTAKALDLLASHYRKTGMFIERSLAAEPAPVKKRAAENRRVSGLK
jgi:GntR family transcriptional regulator, carbon starvation induced regulator